MRVIIAGSRGITDYERVRQAIDASGFAVSRIVSGMAQGVDTLAVRYAEENGIPCDRFPADWQRWGKSAGYRRNEVMAQHADALVAVWDGKSPGTKHMIETAKKHGLRVYVAGLTQQKYRAQSVAPRSPDNFDREVAKIRRTCAQWYADGLVPAPWDKLGVEGKLELLALRAAAHDVAFARFSAAAKHVLGGGVQFTADDEWHNRRLWKSARKDWGRDPKAPGQPDPKSIRQLLDRIESVTKGRFYEDPAPVASPVEMFLIRDGRPGGEPFAELSVREKGQALWDYAPPAEHYGISVEQKEQIIRNIVLEDKPRAQWLDGTGLDGQPVKPPPTWDDLAQALRDVLPKSPPPLAAPRTGAEPPAPEKGKGPRLGR